MYKRNVAQNSRPIRSNNNNHSNFHNCYKLLSDALRTENYLNCVICNTTLQCPIVLIEKKGNACERCYIKSAIMTHKAIRNEALEFVIKKTLIQCKNRDNGCKEEITYAKIKEHEENCNYETIQCLISNCAIKSTLQTYRQHFELYHKRAIIDEIDNAYEIDLAIDRFVDEVYMLKNNTANSTGYFLKIYNKVTFGDAKAALHVKTCYQLYEIDDNPRHNRQFIIQHIGDNGDKFELSSHANSLKKLSQSTIIEKSFNRSILGALSSHSCVKVIIRVVDGDDSNRKIDDSKIKECLECPICLIIMRPPIYQCQTGHTLCRDCKMKIRQCPSCKSVLENTRNYALEMLTADWLYECGSCNEMIAGKLLEEHEARCAAAQTRVFFAKKKRSKSVSRL